MARLSDSDADAVEVRTEIVEGQVALFCKWSTGSTNHVLGFGICPKLESKLRMLFNERYVQALHDAMVAPAFTAPVAEDSMAQVGEVS